MLYLVKGTLTRTEYMAEDSIEEEVLRLVEAETGEVAEHIFKSYYESQTSEYSQYVSCWVDSVDRVLTKEDISC